MFSLIGVVWSSDYYRVGIMEVNRKMGDCVMGTKLVRKSKFYCSVVE
jgi:hypothetical protein